MNGLAALLAFGIAMAWSPASWPWRLEQVAILLLTALGLGLKRFRVSGSAALIPLGLITAWPFLQTSIGAAAYAWAAQDSGLMWLTWTAAFVVALSRWDDTKVEWLAGFGGAVGFIALLQKFTAPDGKAFWMFDTGFTEAIMGPFVYSNQYAAFVQLVLPAALVLTYASGRLHVGWAACSAMLIVSVVASGSRAGLALLLIETVVVLSLVRAGKRAGALIAFLGLFAVITGWQFLAERLVSAKVYEDRWMLTQSTLDMIRDRPVVGFGAGSWSRTHPAYSRFDDGLFDNHAHNDWAEWAAEGGLPYAALILIFGIAIAPAAWRTVWGVGLVSVLLHCWMEYHFHERPAFGALYFAVAGGAVRSYLAGRQLRAKS